MRCRPNKVLKVAIVLLTTLYLTYFWDKLNSMRYSVKPISTMESKYITHHSVRSNMRRSDKEDKSSDEDEERHSVYNTSATTLWYKEGDDGKDMEQEDKDTGKDDTDKLEYAKHEEKDHTEKEAYDKNEEKDHTNKEEYDDEEKDHTDKEEYDKSEEKDQTDKEEYDKNEEKDHTNKEEYDKNEEKDHKDKEEYAKNEEKDHKDKEEYDKNEEKDHTDKEEYDKNEEKDQTDNEEYDKNEEKDHKDKEEYDKNEEKDHKDKEEYDKNEEKDHKDKEEYDKNEEKDHTDKEEYDKNEEKDHTDKEEYDKNEEKNHTNKEEYDKNEEKDHTDKEEYDKNEENDDKQEKQQAYNTSTTKTTLRYKDKHESSGEKLDKNHEYNTTLHYKDRGDTNATHTEDNLPCFEDRRQRLEALCQKDDFKGPKIPPNFIVDRTKKLMYCEVTKIGSTFWKSVFAVLAENNTNVTTHASNFTKNSSEIHNLHFVRFNELTPHQQQIMMTSSRLMLFVRDPYMRLLSAYMDTFVRPNQFYWHQYGTIIINCFRSQSSRADRECGQDVTFQEFISFFVISQFTVKKFNNMDPHWTPIYQLCSPCDYPYYYIGKMETRFEDTRDIFRSANLSHVVDINPLKKDEPTEDEAISRHASQFIDEYAKASNCFTVMSMLQKFWKYLASKGYIKPNAVLPICLKNIQPVSAEGLKKIMSYWALSVFNQQYYPGSMEAYRKQFATAAYATIPTNQLRMLKSILEKDSILFGYDPEPDYVFSNRD